MEVGGLLVDKEAISLVYGELQAIFRRSREQLGVRPFHFGDGLNTSGRDTISFNSRGFFR